MSEHFYLTMLKGIVAFRAVLETVQLKHLGLSAKIKSFEEFCDFTVTVPVGWRNKKGSRYLAKEFRLKSCKAVPVSRWENKTALLWFAMCKRKLV